MSTQTTPIEHDDVPVDDDVAPPVPKRKREKREPSRVRVNLMMDPDNLDAVRAEANSQDRSMSAQVNRILRIYFDGGDAAVREAARAR
jgi:hypothetical protein